MSGKFFSNQKKNPKSVGRPLKLTQEQEEMAINFIGMQANNGSFETPSQLLKYIENEFKIILSYGWINTFMVRNSERICLSTIFPQEETRLQVPRTYLDKFILILKCMIPQVPAELIFNLDECGNSDWEDKKPKDAIIPFELKEERLHFAIKRHIKHATLLATISAAGDAYFPTIYSQNQMSRNVFDHGIREGIDLNIVVGNTSYVTKNAFYEYITRKFLPLVEETKKLNGCEDKFSLLFMDN